MAEYKGSRIYLVALLAARGNSTFLIAKTLDVTPRTVHSHFYNGFLRFGVNTRIALVKKMIQEGSLVVDDGQYYLSKDLPVAAELPEEYIK